VAAAANTTASTLVDGYAMGSLSMTAYGVGVGVDEPDDPDGAPPLPDLPGDGMNV
jgi:4,5-DOPA dioxygenase extradiol